MRLLVSCLLILGALALPARSAEQGLGFTASLTGGLGLHYRRMLSPGWGVGGSGSLWSAGPEVAYSLGVQGLRVLSENRYGRLYLVGGLGATQAHVQPGQPATFAVGSGLGIEIGKAPGPTVSLEGQMTLFGNGVQGWALAPLPAASLIYYY